MGLKKLYFVLYSFKSTGGYYAPGTVLTEQEFFDDEKIRRPRVLIGDGKVMQLLEGQRGLEGTIDALSARYLCPEVGQKMKNFLMPIEEVIEDPVVEEPVVEKVEVKEVVPPQVKPVVQPKTTAPKNTVVKPVIKPIK